MGRGWKIAIGILAGLALLLGVNALVTESETKSAEVNEPGGRILHLRGGDIQVVDEGPATRRRSCSCTASAARSTGGTG